MFPTAKNLIGATSGFLLSLLLNPNCRGRGNVDSSLRGSFRYELSCTIIFRDVHLQILRRDFTHPTKRIILKSLLDFGISVHHKRAAAGRAVNLHAGLAPPQTATGRQIGRLGLLVTKHQAISRAQDRTALEIGRTGERKRADTNGLNRVGGTTEKERIIA